MKMRDKITSDKITPFHLSVTVMLFGDAAFVKSENINGLNASLLLINIVVLVHSLKPAYDVQVPMQPNEYIPYIQAHRKKF